MTQTIYTLISYLPGEEGWRDRCGDFHRGRDSELNIEYFTDQEVIGEFYAQTKFSNNDLVLTILINGIEPDKYCNLFDNKEEEKKLLDEEGEIISIAYKKIDILNQMKAKHEAELKLKQQLAEKERKLKEQQRIEQNERMQLAQLIAKYQSK